jgi:hypothetical protein
VRIDAPLHVKSVHGEKSTAPAGSGSRASRIAQREKRREREAAASGIARNHNFSRRRARFPQRAIRGERIVERGRKAMLRREPVIQREQTRPRARGQPDRDRAMRTRRAKVIAAAVQIKNRDARGCSRRRDPLALERRVLRVEPPAFRRLRQPRTTRCIRASARDIDMRTGRFRQHGTPHDPARQRALPTHRAGFNSTA